VTPLRWTRTPPTEAGWWWMKDHAGKSIPVEIRMVDINEVPEPHAVGGVFSVHVPIMRGLWWSDRTIVPPEEGS